MPKPGKLIPCGVYDEKAIKGFCVGNKDDKDFLKHKESCEFCKRSYAIFQAVLALGNTASMERLSKSLDQESEPWE